MSAELRMSEITIRAAGVEDIDLLVRHRRMMWWDMGRRNEGKLKLMEEAAREYFAVAVSEGSYRVCPARFVPRLAASTAKNLCDDFLVRNAISTSLRRSRIYPRRQR